jgi:hypothetical protein
MDAEKVDAGRPEPEIKVSDRRRFSAEGEPLNAAEEEAPPGETPAESDWAPPPLPPASFEFLVLSFRLQAEMQLGLYRSEKGAEPLLDLEGARHSIDLLGVLQEKTRGNLSLEEQRLLDNTLTELRFRYVQAVERLSQKT